MKGTAMLQYSSRGRSVHGSLDTTHRLVFVENVYVRFVENVFLR